MAGRGECRGAKERREVAEGEAGMGEIIVDDCEDAEIQVSKESQHRARDGLTGLLAQTRGGQECRSHERVP